MAEQWVTLSDAASTLKCSTRTIERRIKRGELESRLTDVGREVLVDIPDDTTDTVSDIQRQAMLVIADHDEAQRAIVERLTAVMSVPIERAEAEARRARTSGRLGWSTVAVLVIAGGIGLWWSTKQVTSITSTNVALSDKLTDTERQLAEERQRVEAEEHRVNTERQRSDTLTDTLSKVREEKAVALAETARQASTLSATLSELEAVRTQLKANQDELAKALTDKVSDTTEPVTWGQWLGWMKRSLARGDSE